VRVPRFVVTGAGEWGLSMARRLLRARDRGRLELERIVLVDRDPALASAVPADPSVTFVAAAWDDWLDGELHAFGDGHLVPYHWAPHLLSGWLSRRLREAGARVAPAGPPAPVGTPYEAETAGGDRALSYATWPCPPSCIEPDLCPHTRGPRDWSLAGKLRDGGPERVVFPCLHLVWGVGTVPVADVLAARDRLCARLGGGEPFVAEIGTASHCHGLLARVAVTPA
jgi:hypothetical protein